MKKPKFDWQEFLIDASVILALLAALGSVLFAFVICEPWG